VKRVVNIIDYQVLLSSLILKVFQLHLNKTFSRPKQLREISSPPFTLHADSYGGNSSTAILAQKTEEILSLSKD